MFDRLKNAIKRRAKRLFRRGNHAQHSASKQESAASNSNRHKNGAVGSTTETGHKKSAERPTGENADSLPAGAHGVAEHLAAHDIEPASRLPRLEIPGEPLTVPEARSSHSIEDRAFNPSDSSVAVSRQASLHTTKDLHVPEITVSNHQAEALQERPLGSSPLETTQEERQQAQIGHPQSTGKAGGSTGSLAQHSDVTHDELLHYDLSSEKVNASYDEEAADKSDRERAELKTPDLDSNLDSVQSHTDVDFDHTVHTRSAVTHEEVKPHIHTIYEPRRTRSIHFHEHKTLIQPIIDPNPTILPEEHWAQDHITGEIFKIPNELGRQLMADDGLQDTTESQRC